MINNKNNVENIYSEYLNSQMQEFELIIKLDELQDKSVKSDGVIYTPWNIVNEMISISNPTPDMKIIEPACGHGIFLFGLLSHMKDKHNINGIALLEWFKSNVVGIDIVENTTNELKEILSYYFKKHCSLEVSPNDFTNIINDNGLYFDNGIEYDLCIGNPPYIRTKNLEQAELIRLRENFESCKKGNVDIYYAFIEKYSTTAKELCFITPNSFLVNVSGKKLKEIISDRLTYLIDFKDKLVFKDARTYTCIFKTLRDQSIDKCLYANDIDVKPELIDKELILGADNSMNGIVSTVLSGVATLCDSVYIVRKSDDDKFYAAHNGVSYEIEKELVAPYLKITKQKDNEFSNISYMIYPYHDDKSVINEVELKAKYPMAHTYLLAMKDRLLQRDKGKTDKYESWYAYGRKQGLHVITEKFVVIVPQMIGGECKPHLINISNLLTNYGRIVFTSGFVIPKNNENKVACDYLLTQNFIDFAKKNGKAWPGKDEAYYSLTSKQIKKFKV